MAFFCQCGHPMEHHLKMTGRCTVRGQAAGECGCGKFQDRSKMAPADELEKRPEVGGVETRVG